MIQVNGQSSTQARPGDSVAQVLQRLGLNSDVRGVAVAVDGEVVPRSDWNTFTLAADARVEVLSAMQGG